LEPNSDLQSYLGGALATLGIEADETERAVMAAVWGIWEPGLRELLDHELSDAREDNPDLSRAPEVRESA
jgi:hypothetical protein